MKLLSRLTEGKHIAVYAIGNLIPLQGVYRMILEHYDTSEFDSTIFVINGFLYDDKGMLEVMHRYKRAIYYNLEHLEVSTQRYAEYLNDLINWCNININEFWEFELENIKHLRNLTIPIIFAPMRFVTLDKPERSSEPIYHCGILGGLDEHYQPHRRGIFSDISGYLFSNDGLEKPFSIINIIGKTIYEAKDEISKCKFLLDTLSIKVPGCTQNQVRIFEYLSLGYSVLTETVDGLNYFPNMVCFYYYPYDHEMVYENVYCYDLVDTAYDYEPIDFSQKYKDMTYTDEAYNKYRQDLLYAYNSRFEDKIILR